MLGQLGRVCWQGCSKCGQPSLLLVVVGVGAELEKGYRRCWNLQWKAPDCCQLVSSAASCCMAYIIQQLYYIISTVGHEVYNLVRSKQACHHTQADASSRAGLYDARMHTCMHHGTCFVARGEA